MVTSTGIGADEIVVNLNLSYSARPVSLVLLFIKGRRR
jgi:hypothetical protein